MLAKTLLVILPGWGGTRDTWREFVAAMSTNVQVECLDLPCFGDTPCPETVWGVHEYAEYVHEKLGELRDSHPDTNIVLLGHSFGGQVAVVVAAKENEKLSGLILSGAAIFRPHKFFRRGIFGLIAKVGKLVFRIPILEKGSVFARKFLYRAVNSPDYTQTAGIKRDIFKKIIRQDVSLYLPGLRLPTLVVWGDKDRYVPVASGKRIVKLLPHGTLKVFPNAGHGLHMSHIQPLREVVAQFISDL